MMVGKAIYSTESAKSRCPHSLLQRITEVLEYFYFKYCILYYFTRFVSELQLILKNIFGC